VQAGDPLLGYDSTPQNADGSLNFSGWGSALSGISNGSSLGSVAFTRNDIDYSVQVNSPSNLYGETGTAAKLLVANLVTSDSGTWSYSFRDGSAASSVIWYRTGNGNWLEIQLNASSLAYYKKTSAGSLAIAYTGTATLAGQGGTAPQLTYSEVLDITSNGRVIHHLTFTNTSGATLTDIGFMALLDTWLGGTSQPADNIPVVANGTDSAYIDNGGFRLYLDMDKGDLMETGPYSPPALHRNFVDVNGQAPGTTLLTGADSTVTFTLANRDLAAGASESLVFEERLLAPEEVVMQTATVEFVDDNASGAAVTPVAGTVTTLTGLAGDPIVFTTADAQAGAPAGYEVAAITGATTYDDNPMADQVVTVHLTHHVTTSTLTTTRTITYTGAGHLTPAQVIQTQVWAVATDAATGVTTYRGSGYDPVQSPVIADWSADIPSTPAQFAATTTTKPANETVTINYTGSVTTTRTITYAGAGAATPAHVVQELTWTAVVDAAGAITYESAGYPAAASPVVAGYTAVTATVPATGALTSATKPANSTVTVTYVAYATSTRTIIYQGAGDKNPAPVVQTLTWAAVVNPATGAVSYAAQGYPEAQTPTVDGWTPDQTSVPATGVLTSADKPADSVVKVSFTGTYLTVRTIAYQGAGAKTPAPVTQTLTWTVVIDDAGVATYRSEGAPAVDTPVVPGYVVDKATVAATGALVLTPLTPADSTITVTYTGIVIHTGGYVR
jgi:hypothetical protein